MRLDEESPDTVKQFKQSDLDLAEKMQNTLVV